MPDLASPQVVMELISSLRELSVSRPEMWRTCWFWREVQSDGD